MKADIVLLLSAPETTCTIHHFGCATAFSCLLFFFQWTLEFHLALVTATGNIYTIIFTYYTNFPLTINETNSQNFAKHSLCQDILFNPMF